MLCAYGTNTPIMDDLCLRNNDTSKWFLMTFQSVYEWLREKEKVEGREGLKYENLARWDMASSCII